MLTSQNKLGQIVGRGDLASIANTVDSIVRFAFYMYKLWCNNQKGNEDTLLIEDCLNYRGTSFHSLLSFSLEKLVANCITCPSVMYSCLLA